MRSAELAATLQDARSLGFLGPGPVEDQLLHAERLAAAIGDAPGTFLDLGSGGGLPGLVLGVIWPQAGGVLLDAQQRRCHFLRGACDRLQLQDRVGVVCGRAETLARDAELRGRFELVVARAFGPPAATAECGVGFLAAGGRLVVTEPPGGMSELRWPTDGLARLGLTGPESIRYGDTGAVVLRSSGEVAGEWPRREGVPTRRPLWRVPEH